MTQLLGGRASTGVPTVDNALRREFFLQCLPTKAQLALATIKTMTLLELAVLYSGCED